MCHKFHFYLRGKHPQNRNAETRLNKSRDEKLKSKSGFNPLERDVDELECYEGSNDSYWRDNEWEVNSIAVYH